jgi:surface antigen
MPNLEHAEEKLLYNNCDWQAAKNLLCCSYVIGIHVFNGNQWQTRQAMAALTVEMVLENIRSGE